MPRFFLPSGSFENGEAVITGSDARHISLSLRMAVGDPIVLCDMRENEYSCVISEISPDRVRAKILSSSRSESEPPSVITLYQAIAKGEKMDNIVQKSVELGACRIVPVRTERCIAKITPDAEDGKVKRWQKIASEAAGQCGRGIIPQVMSPVSFENALDEMKKDELAFVCYEGDGTLPLTSILDDQVKKSISFLIGPEGGLSAAETELARRKGISLAGLGKRILRTETAPCFVLSCISFSYELGDKTPK